MTMRRRHYPEQKGPRPARSHLPRAPAWAAAILLAAAAALLTVLAASAHAKYERSEPADGAVLAQPPSRVDVYFSQEMTRSGGLPSLVVVNDVGDRVDLGAKLDDNDRKHIYADLAPALPPGRYTVIWHTLSDEDAEEAQGAFHFYVGPGPSGAPPAAPVATTAPAATPAAATLAATAGPAAAEAGGDSSLPIWALVAGIAGGLLAGGAGGYGLARRSGG